MTGRGLIGAVLAGVLAAAAGGLSAYPLDGYGETQIRRLRAYRLIQEGLLRGHFELQPGALLGAHQIRLRLADLGSDWDITADTPTDPELQVGIERLFRNRDSSYKLAMVDVTDPASPRYARLRADQGYIPGSVAKLLIMAGLLDQLRRLHPDSIEERQRLLRETEVVADRFVVPNHHAIPVVAPDFASVAHRAVRVGDRFSLWEWLDHMVSPSSNAAASMVWKQVLLLDALGADYPPTPEQEAAYFEEAGKPELIRRSVEVLERPSREAGLDHENFHVRTFFTRTASSVIPGQGSHSTPNGILRWLVKMEQGRLVDRWSSLEMKKMLYFTRRRYRYASSEALNDAAVYFKSGSLYRCKQEEGYECGQYRGNVMNLMHSVAIVESPREGNTPLVYLVSMMSNVLKVNSAWEHAVIAAEIEKLVRERNS